MVWQIYRYAFYATVKVIKKMKADAKLFVVVVDCGWNEQWID